MTQKSNNDAAGIKGIVTLTLRDAETLEVVSERTEYNSFSIRAAHQMGGNDVGDSGILMATSVHDMSDSSMISGQGAYLNMVYRATVQQAWVTITGTPNYKEAVERFTAPTSTRFIQHVMLVEGTDRRYDGIISRVTLDPPCEQTSTQVLDITYRIQYTESTIPAVTDNTKYCILNEMFDRSTTTYPRNNPRYTYSSFHKPPTMVYHQFGNDMLRTVTGSVIGGVYDQRLQRKNMTTTMVQTSRVGSVFGNFVYGLEEENFWTTGSEAYNSASYCLPATTPDFTNAPIQPTHNHNPTAPLPFLDVNNLADGSGAPVYDGSGWLDQNYPKYLRLDIANTGDVGVARYSLRYRNLVGFDDNTYKPDKSSVAFIKDRAVTGGMKAISGAHGMSVSHAKDMVLYNSTTVVNCDSTGITLVDIMDGAYATFDSTSTPPMPMSNRRYVAVDDSDGSVWVPSPDYGLYKISDALGTPTVTHFDNATHGIPSGGDIACYAVSVGKGGVVWAVFDGGLCKTSNGGTTWEIYDANSTHPFSYTGISDGNWSTVIRLVVDPESDTFEMAVLKQGSTAYNNRVVWWSDVDTAVNGSTGAIPHWLVCSRYGGMWVWNDPASTSVTGLLVYPHFLTYGSSSTISVDDGNHSFSPLVSQPMFFYDYYNVPYTVAKYSSTSGQIGVFSHERKLHDRLTQADAASYEEIRVVNFGAIGDGSGKGVQLTHFHSGYNTPFEAFGVTPVYTVDSLNGKHSPFEEFMWDKHNWNGSTWEIGYHKEAIDTSINNYDGIRHNFDVEDYTFTGRSMIDVGTTFATDNFSTVGTFAFKLTPNTKLSGGITTISRQELQTAVFEVHDGNNRFILYWDDGTGNMVMQDDAASIVAQVTPAVDIAYRCVVVISNTTAVLYVDGVLISTLTLTAPIDMSNQNSTLYAHLGARTHTHSLNNRYNVGHFFSGVMENVQMWNVEWDQADVTEDMVNVDGVKASTVGLISRFELTQSLVGLETKTTHIGNELMIDGITNSFVDGVVGPSFVEGEFYTTGIVDGFLKDNAMTITHNGYLYLTSELEPSLTTITNSVDGTAIVPGTSGSTTEPVVFFQSDLLYVWTRPGDMVYSYMLSDYSSYGQISAQSSTGDISVTFTLHYSYMEAAIGFTDIAPDSRPGTTALLYGIRTDYTRAMDFYRAGSIGTADVATGVLGGETYRLQRVSGVVSLYQVLDGGDVELHTSAVTSTGALAIVVALDSRMAGFSDMQITYDRPAQSMVFGSELGQTGVYAPNYLGATNSVPTWLKADGVDLDIVYTSLSNAFKSEPPAGTVYLSLYSGYIKFHSAEIGKTITGSIGNVTHTI